MISYSHLLYTAESGSPTVHDIAVQLARIPRWCGATEPFWPVLAHSLVVADALKAYGPLWELAGLTHDWSEALGVSDISFSLKTPCMREVEHRLRDRIVWELCGRMNIRQYWDSDRLKQVDADAAAIEKWLLIGGYEPYSFSQKCHDSTTALVDRFCPVEYLNPYGEPVKYFLKRFEELKRELHSMWCGASGEVSTEAAPVGTGEPEAVTGCRSRSVVNEQPSGGVVLGKPHVERSSYIDCCSVCGAVYLHSKPHACHPDADGYAGPI
jgi:hypothetical protein